MPLPCPKPWLSPRRRLLPRLCASALVLAACSRGGLPPSLPSPLLGRALPALERTTTGACIDRAKLQGRVVVVKFFADYCKPCEWTLPKAQRLHESLPEVVFVGVSLDERRTTLESLLRRHVLTFPIIHDRAKRVAGRFRVTELPITFVVDRQGTIRWVGGPDHPESDLERALDSLL